MEKIILVLSDSHKNMINMHIAVERMRPDLILHLGDHYSDAKLLSAEFPDIPLEAVRGNCDAGSTNMEKLLTIDGKRIFMCHGHRYHVKSGYLSLEYAAREKEADVVLFGHTHCPYLEQRDGLILMNPGSIGEPRDPGSPSYGMLYMEEGQVFARVMYLHR